MMYRILKTSKLSYKYFDWINFIFIRLINTEENKELNRKDFVVSCNNCIHTFLFRTLVLNEISVDLCC